MGIADREAIRRNLINAGQNPTEEAINIWARHGASLEAMEGELFRGEIHQSTIDGLYNQDQNLSDYTFNGEHIAGFEDENGNQTSRIDAWKPGRKVIYGSSVNGVTIRTVRGDDGTTRRIKIFDDSFQGNIEGEIGHGEMAVVSDSLSPTWDGERIKVRGKKDGWTTLTRVDKEQWYQDEWALIAAGVLAAVATGGVGVAALGGSSIAGAAGTAFAGSLGLSGIAGTAVALGTQGAIMAAASSFSSSMLQTRGDLSESFDRAIKAAGEGAVAGAITGGLLGYGNAQAIKETGQAMGRTGQALAYGTGAVATEFFSGGDDFVEAFASAGAKVALGNTEFGNATVNAVETLAAGGDWKDVALSAGVGWTEGKFTRSPEDSKKLAELNHYGKMVRDQYPKGTNPKEWSDRDKSRYRSIAAKKAELNKDYSGFMDQTIRKASSQVQNMIVNRVEGQGAGTPEGYAVSTPEYTTPTPVSYNIGDRFTGITRPPSEPVGGELGDVDRTGNNVLSRVRRPTASITLPEEEEEDE